MRLTCYPLTVHKNIDSVLIIIKCLKDPDDH
jgi:hypothetical protein